MVTILFKRFKFANFVFAVFLLIGNTVVYVASYNHYKNLGTMFPSS
jgi:hypothetical protein